MTVVLPSEMDDMRPIISSLRHLDRLRPHPCWRIPAAPDTHHRHLRARHVRPAISRDLDDAGPPPARRRQRIDRRRRNAQHQSFARVEAQPHGPQADVHGHDLAGLQELFLKVQVVGLEVRGVRGVGGTVRHAQEARGGDAEANGAVRLVVGVALRDGDGEFLQRRLAR
jgi:hypothetical protein